MESCVLQKKSYFCFLFFPPFFAFFRRGLVFFHVFWCFFFMVVLGTNASCGTKEALFFEYFWHSFFLRRILAECFFCFFPSCMTYQVVLQWGTHIYGRCGMWDVGSVCDGMNMCKCECKSMMTWQIEVQWGPHIYRRCGI